MAIQHLVSLFSDEYRFLVEKLIKARKFAGMTQVDLAKALGRPQSFVAKFEGGERRLDPAEYIKIMLALEADPLLALSELITANTKKAKSK